MTFIYDALGVVFGPVMSAIYSLVQNYGIAIILFTILCRLVMLPTAIMQQKSAAKNSRMQMKVNKIREKYKGDPQRQQQETSEFYQREGYNPMSAGCSGGMMLQFPIMFGLIAAIYRPLQYTLKVPADILTKLGEAAQKILVDDKGKAIVTENNLQIQLRIAENIEKFSHLFGEGKLSMDWYNAIHEFTDNFMLFGLKLGQTPREGGGIYYLIPILAGVSSMALSVYTFLRQRKLNPDTKQNALMMGCMSFGMPLMSAVFAISFPVGIGMYWIVGSLIAFVQTVILNYTHPPQKMLAKLLVEETIERRSKEAHRKNLAEYLG